MRNIIFLGAISILMISGCGKKSPIKNGMATDTYEERPYKIKNKWYVMHKVCNNTRKVISNNVLTCMKGTIPVYRVNAMTAEQMDKFQSDINTRDNWYAVGGTVLTVGLATAGGVAGSYTPPVSYTQPSILK